MGARIGSLLVAAAAFMAACGGQSGSTQTTDAGPDTTDAPAAVVDDPSAAPQPNDAAETTVLVARTDSEIAVHTAPGGPEDHVLPATTAFGSPRALLVLEEQDEWLEVSLPERPNGSTGWVRRDAVELRSVDEAVEIDLAARSLRLLDGGETVLTTPVAIGSDDAPTPTGSFFVVDKLATDDPASVYGLFAFGLSAFSGIFTDFAGGDGQVGIHGTNDPASIGQAVSHGCIRVPNEVAEALNQLLSLGTPVTIR
jgi:lipoprotein-anchoring transpeptidase ErfK/SrfK